MCMSIHAPMNAYEAHDNYNDVCSYSILMILDITKTYNAAILGTNQVLNFP